MSVAGLVMRNQVNANQLHRWVMLNQRAWPASAPSLLPVTIEPEPAVTARAFRGDEQIEIVVADVVVRVPMDVQAATLHTVLEVLRGMAR